MSRTPRGNYNAGMSSSATPLQPDFADADYRRRRLVILGSVVLFCSIVTVCFCTWVGVMVTRARAAQGGGGAGTASSSVQPAVGSLCP